MADQQPAVVRQTASHQPHLVMNGLQLKLDSQDHPFASFSYALSPLTVKLTPVDWKLLVTMEDDVESQHIRCHELKTGDNLPKLIADFQKAYAVAVVLINTIDDHFLHPSFLTEMQQSNFPVLLLTKGIGMALLNKVEQYEENVFARIRDKSLTDLPVQHTQQKVKKRPTYTSREQTAAKEPGYYNRFKQFFYGDKSSSVSLKRDLRKLIFTASGELLVICEDAGIFTLVMTTFNDYEEHVSSHADVIEALKMINHHLSQTYVQDFPFYLVLAYKMHSKPVVYQCDELSMFIRSCIEKMENTKPHQVASTFLTFLQRGNFMVPFDSGNTISVFHLLQQACLEMAKMSHAIHQETSTAAKSPQPQIYQRFMWVSLYLRLDAESGNVMKNAVVKELWCDLVIKFSPHGQVVMKPETVMEVKEGLEFGRQVYLPSNLTFCPLLLAKLFASEGQVRPFQHLRHYIQTMAPYIPQEKDFLSFITQIRAEYDSWWKQASGQDKLSVISVEGTLSGTLQESLGFLDTLHIVLTERKFNLQAFEPECRKWLLLLLQLVDITGENPHIHLRRFLLTKAGVVKQYRRDIIKHVVEVTHANFPRLTIMQIFPLYKSFHIWPKKFLEEYLQQYKIPLKVKISDNTWREVFSEVIKRFSGAQHHHYLLDFLQSVAECYYRDGRAGDLVVDLLKLRVPKLFAVEWGREEDEAVRHMFSAFLRGYISRCAINHTILEKMDIVVGAISDQKDEFQQLVLAVVLEVIQSQVKSKALQGEKSISNRLLYSMLHQAVNALCKDLSWLQALTTKQWFCWGIVAAYCGKISVTEKHFEWVHSYHFVITHLGHIYNSYCAKKNLPEDKRLLSAEDFTPEIAHSLSEDIKRYFDYVRGVQAVLLEWHQKFAQQQINYDEILTYTAQQQLLEHLAQTVCALSIIVDITDIRAMQKMFLNTFEQLNALLIKYIPGQPDAKWCTLPSLLQDWGIALPPCLMDLISRHVVFPGEENKAGELLNNLLSPSTTGIFQPGHGISLKLTKALTLRELFILVQGLEAFLQPVMDVLDMLVFFKLHPSEMFDKYLQVYMKKESELDISLREQRSATTLSTFSFTVPVFSATSVRPHSADQSAVEGLPLHVLLRAMNHTNDLLMKLMQGTAAYFEIVAEGELNLEKLDIEREFSALHSFSAYLKLPLPSYEGLSGVRSMLELFQYVHHIRTIHSVCEQYQLQGCLEDPELVKLLCLVKDLDQEENRAKLTPLDASKKLETVKNTLCLRSSRASPHCLELFTAVSDSAAFYQFVRDKQFVGKKGQAMFQQQYQLVTTQLQHEEYDETVLNHLYVAFKLIQPFLDAHQSFYQLMSQVTSLDMSSVKLVEKVNANIDLIQFWFFQAEGDTLKYMTKKLDCIIMTGYYYFLTLDTRSSRLELILNSHMFPHVNSQLDSQNGHETGVAQVVNVQHWNSKQISDFVCELGFLDAEGESEDKIKHFMHINETAYKLLNLYVRLRELGHPQYIQPLMNDSLACSINREEADQRVHETEIMLTEWLHCVYELRSRYDWLLFFSVPKLLLLYHLLLEENPNLEAIVHEISFLCSNEQGALESVRVAVEESFRSFQNCIKSDSTPMHIVGEFLRMVFNNRSLPKHQCEDLSHLCSVSQLSSLEAMQLLHYCPGYSQAQLIRLIVSIYSGIPEAFEVFRCRSSSTEEELILFFKRAKKHPLQYLVLEINRLPFKLQKCLMELLKREVETSSKAPCFHFIETIPSFLREMPRIMLREHIMESGPYMSFEEARKICLIELTKTKDIACVQLVYGHAGDGKTHYIQQQLTHSPTSLTVAINEAFTPLNAILKLRTLPLNQTNCAIFFNFTLLSPGESVNESKRVRHQQLMEIIGWFFFELLMLRYVEDSDTGISFCLPRRQNWVLYVEVPSQHNMTPEEALKHFQRKVPALGLLGTPHYIDPQKPYFVDEEVQLVCKYLKALKVGGKRGIDRLYEESCYSPKPVKFSSEPDLPVNECQQLLLQFMPCHVQCTKITQRLFIKYMKRRCCFLDNLPTFNYNTGKGQHITDNQGKRVHSDTRQLGSTLMTTMLKEVEDFCDPAIRQNWCLKPLQQLVYNIKDGTSSLDLISIHPDKLPEQDKMKFKKIGFSIPSMHELYSRRLLDGYLSQALNVELEDGRLTPIDDSAYVLTLDSTIKMLNLHERYQCGVPVIIEGETGVGKTALVEMLSKLWNRALLVQWKRQCSQLLDLIQRKLVDISANVSGDYMYQACVQTVERLSVDQHVSEEDLVLLGQLPVPIYGHKCFYSLLRSILLPMRSNPVIVLLTQPESQQQEASVEQLFERAEIEDSAEVKPTFHKLNVHATMTPTDIWSYLEPVFTQAKKLREVFKSNMADQPTPRVPFVTVFLDEVNTSSCAGLFKEIIVDQTFDGNPIPDNVFIVAACTPHHGNSLAFHSQMETWFQGSYNVQQLHPTLRFLMWDYGSLDEHQERDYINAKMKMLNKQMSNAEVASLTELIVSSQKLMRNYAFRQLCSGGLTKLQAKLSSHSCVSQRDIQRVFTLYQWVMDSYTKYQPYGARRDYSRRAVLVALGIVYYMRLNSQYRKHYEEYLDKVIRLPHEVSFSQVFNDELDWYIHQVKLPTGIARTQALKENLFATIVCTVTHTPLIIVGAPGSSKTLSFNLAITILKGQESKMRHFRDFTVFRSLDPHFYQCSRWTTSNEIQMVFCRAINRQRSHFKFKLPIYCVVFLDQAGLLNHESLEVLHYHLDRQEVSFVATSNHILDAAMMNRTVSVFRPEASEEDLKTLAKGCLCTTPDNPPPELKMDLNMIVRFCPAYSHLMTKPEFGQYFGVMDFIHFVSYLRRHRDQMLTPQLVMKALERNFNGSNIFDKICNTFFNKVHSNIYSVHCRGILEVLRDSLEDRPQQQGWDMAEVEVRYKLIIDPSEDESLVQLLFSFGVLQRKETRMFVCSDFPRDNQLQKINTVAAICHSAIKGHTVVMTHTDDVYEGFYDFFNQHFCRIDDPKEGTYCYTHIAIGAHLKVSRVNPNFQCVVVIKKSEVKNTPVSFLSRFEKYCITHHSLLEEALSHLPPCMRIIIETTMEKIQDFIDRLSGPSSLYGLQPETLDSLVLSLLPPLTHSYESLGEPSVTDSGLDLKVLLMQELLQNLRHYAGLHIPSYSLEEFHLDVDCLFGLVLSDPEFEGLLPNLSHYAILQAVAEAMRVLYTAPVPQEGVACLDLSPQGCLVVALLQQWLVRHLCKQLMQLMTSEAFMLYRNMLPSSYLENYISFQAHFSLKELILKYHQSLEYSRGNPANSPTKLLCFTRSSPLIHQLPAQHPSSVFETQAAENILHDLVFPDPSQLAVCKLSSLLSQSSVQELLKGFVRSNTAQVCLLVVNMQETSRKVVNHLRIMIEEAEMLSTQRAKLFVILLHFPPAQFFNPCYPSLFLKGWDHYYLDTIAHHAVRGVVDIGDWFWQCCFSKEALLHPENDSLVLALNDILPEAIPILSSRVFFGSSPEGSFNQPMSGSQRSKALRELLFEKGVGQVLCERFRSYWKPAVMAEYLEKAAMFIENQESTLNITDSVQTLFKGLFFDFLVYLLSRVNEEFNIDVLFDADRTPTVQELFLDILRVFPLPKLSQLSVLSTSLPAPASDHSPRFPFFKVVWGAVERIVEQSHEDTNVRLDFLQEGEAVSGDSVHDHTAIYSMLQEAVGGRIKEKLETTPKETVVLAIEAMGLHFDLWQRYFDDFIVQLGGLQGGAISQQILHVFFGQLHQQETLVHVVSLHCYMHVYHLDLAKMANLLRPLNQIQGNTNTVPYHSMESDPWPLVSAVQLTQNPLGTPKRVATLLVNKLFTAIVAFMFGQDTSITTVPEKMSIWFKAYRDVMTLSELKQQVYVSLEPRKSGGGKLGKEMMEAQLNVMQTVFLVILTSISLGADFLLKGQWIFQALISRYFTEALELKVMYPHLADVFSVAVEVISETSRSLSVHCDSCSIRLLMEGLFAHFFSPYRRGYHTEDVKWFLELANEQEQWGANPLQCSAMVDAPFDHVLDTRTKVSQGAVSMHVFKLYLGRILRTCDQCCDDLAFLSGPLLLYYQQPRQLVGNVLMATPDLGPPAPYIPIFYQEHSIITPKANQNLRMQQPLAHLYFLTLLEHLQAKEHKLSTLVHAANTIIKLCTSPTTGEVEGVVLWVELQVVVQVLLQQMASYLHLSEAHRMREVQPLVNEINRLLDDVNTGGGDTLGHGHGMVLAMHMIKQLKSSQKFTELMTKKYDSIHCGLHCLQPIHEQLADPLEPKPHLLPFMLPGAKGTALGTLYLRVRRVMIYVHEGREEVEVFIRIADECMRGGSPPLQFRESNASDERLCFRMMVWLCAYYDFYDKKVTSQLLCNVIGDQLAPYLQEEGYIRLIQCFLDPQLMCCCPESPNYLLEDTLVMELSPRDDHHTLKRRQIKIDPLYQLFVPNRPQQIDQSDIDLCYSLANLVGVILGSPSHSNHLWYHLFNPKELHGTHMTGFMYDAKINPDGLLYDCGVELSPEGQFGQQDYVKRATQGTYTLHSLYILLWANFGAFCMSLLTQPEAEAAIHGPIISKRLSVRHYCVSQLRSMWMHMRNNLGLSDEEQSFLVTRCTKRLYEMLNTGTVDCLQGIFRTRQELDSYEQMWHTCVYQPSWNELKEKFAQYSHLWLNKLFIEIRHLQLSYPHFPTVEDFTHSVLNCGDIQSHTQGGDLYILTRFAQEWPRLQAGGLLLPDLVKFYQWLHTGLAHLVTYECAMTLPLGQAVELVVERYSKEEGEHFQALYRRVKDGYNQYVGLIGVGGTIGAEACATRQGNKIYAIADAVPLLRFLFADGEEGNDWLYTVMEDIIATHNAIIEDIYSSVQAERHPSLACLLPDEPAKVYLSEVTDSHCIVGKLRSFHGINNLLQLVRSRCQSSFIDSSTKPERHMSISHGLLQEMKAPEFQLSQLQEDIVACFLAGKPLIRIEPSRTPFKFHQSPSNVTIAGTVGSALDVDHIAKKLPDTFKRPLEETRQKQLEYEFHSASYHTMVQVITGLKTAAEHLIKAVMEQSSEGLEQQTLPQFMLMLYDYLSQCGEVLAEIGIRSTSHSQLGCLVELPLPFLFHCLQLFINWVRDGVYDFAALPFWVKTHMSYQDLQSVQQIPLRWTGSHCDLLEEVKQMIEMLKHSEAHITRIAIEATHKPIMQYLQEINILSAEDHLSSYIPSSILIEHYVFFRIALRRLLLTVQQQVEVEGGDNQREQWREFVGDLWEERLPHFREVVYSEGHTEDSFFVTSEDQQLLTDTQTLEKSAQQYTSENVGQFLEEIGLGWHAVTFSREDISGEILLWATEEMLEELGVNSSIERLKIRVLFQRRLQGGVVQYPLQTVLNFLEQYKLNKYCAIFQESGMDGDLLLEANDSVLKELGVSSAIDRIKIRNKYKTFISYSLIP